MNARLARALDQVRDRHAGYYGSLLRTRLMHFYQQPQAMPEMAHDLDNLLTAWDWLLLRKNLDEVYLFIMEIFWLCAQLAMYHTLLPLLDRGIRMLKGLALSEPAGSVAQRKRDLVLSVLLINKGETLQRIGRLTSARIYQEEAENLLRNAESQDERWFEARWRLGRIQALQRYREGHFLEATDLFRSLLSELEAGGLKMWPYSDEAACIKRAEISLHLGYQAWALGRYEEACCYTEQSKALAEQIASEWAAAFSSHARTLALFYHGQVRASRNRGAARTESHARVRRSSQYLNGHVRSGTIVCGVGQI